jgi:hypothetical protein
LNFLGKFFEKLSDFMKIRPVAADLFHADGRTDRHDEAIVALCSFVNAPKNRWSVMKIDN